MPPRLNVQVKQVRIADLQVFVKHQSTAAVLQLFGREGIGTWAHGGLQRKQHGHMTKQTFVLG